MILRALCLALVSACVGVAPAVAQLDGVRRDFVIATATPTGNYFSIGNALCRVLQRQGLYLENEDVTLLGCSASATSGSIQNVELLRTRAVDFALVQSDVMFHAYRGSGRFEGRRADQLRSLLSLNQEPFQVLAGRGSNVETWSDLKGKKVNLGPVGTTANTMFRELFAVHGVGEGWLAQALTMPVGGHAAELCEGNIEVLGQTTGVPNAGLSAAIRRCGAALVSLDTPQIRTYVAERPYYTPAFIPKTAYLGQTTDVRTFGVLATLVATSDTPDIAAYSIVRAVFEGLAELKAMQPALAGIVPEEMITHGLTAPLHPGALRYYRERGWIKMAPKSAPVSLERAVDLLAAASISGMTAPADEPPAVISGALTGKVPIEPSAIVPPAIDPTVIKRGRNSASRGKTQAKGRG